jgi:transcription-repair coupling factor (superfamily II helicase)
MIAVGYDMYLRLLEEAVLEEKGEAPKVQRSCTADINVEACIDKSYVSIGEQRMDLYRRMAAIRNTEDADELFDEIIDRFGEPPTGVRNLIHIALLRGDSAAIGITEIRQFGGALHFRTESVDLDQIEQVEAQPYFRKRVSLYTKEDKVFLKLLLNKNHDPLKEARYFVAAMKKQETE